MRIFDFIYKCTLATTPSGISLRYKCIFKLIDNLRSTNNTRYKQLSTTLHYLISNSNYTRPKPCNVHLLRCKCFFFFLFLRIMLMARVLNVSNRACVYYENLQKKKLSK